MRDLISKGLLTAAAASSVLSMTGGYAVAAEADGGAVGSPGVLSGNTIQVPVEVPVNICGNTVDPVGVLNPAFGNTCGNTSGSAHSSAHETYRRYAPQPPAAYRQAPAPAHAAPAPRPQAHENHPTAAHAPAHAAPKPAHAAPAPAHARPAPPAPAHAAPHAPAPVREHKPAPRPQPGPAVHEAPVSPRPHHQAASSTHAQGAAVGSPGVAAGNLLQAPVELALNACGNTADIVGLLNPAFGNGCGNGTVAPPPPVRHVPPVQPPVEPPVDDRSVVPNTPVAPPHTPNRPVAHHAAPPVVPAQYRPATPPRAEAPQLAETGSDHLLAAAAMSAGLLLGGGILYRRSTAKVRVRGQY